MTDRRSWMSCVTTVVVAMLGIAPVAFAGSSAKPDARVADIVSRVLDAYGGEKALRAERGYHATGDQRAVQTDKAIHTQRWFGRPDRLFLDLAYPDHHEIRVTDGAKGWAGAGVDSLKAVSGIRLEAMRLQTVRLDTPLRLLEHVHELESRGTDKDGCEVLRLPVGPGLHVDYHVDLKTYRITSVTEGMTGPPSIEFTANYDDFRKVDGVLVPFRETTYAGDTETSTYQVISFEWNPKDLDRHLRPGASPAK